MAATLLLIYFNRYWPSETFIILQKKNRFEYMCGIFSYVWNVSEEISYLHYHHKTVNYTYKKTALSNKFIIYMCMVTRNIPTINMPIGKLSTKKKSETLISISPRTTRPWVKNTNASEASYTPKQRSYT